MHTYANFAYLQNLRTYANLAICAHLLTYAKFACMQKLENLHLPQTKCKSHFAYTHKQMKIVNKKCLYKDDYSEGNVGQAAHWNYRRDRFYRVGNNQFSRYNWLEGRLGTEI